MRNPFRRQKKARKKPPTLTSYILHPEGTLHRVKVRSHRAFRWELGLYGVGDIYAFKDGDRMMLHHAGNPVPGGSLGAANLQLGEKMFTSFWIKILSFMSGHPKKPFVLPQWAVVILVFLLIFGIILVR